MLLREELKHDYDTNTSRKLINIPIYHRIKFDKASIYLTESNTSNILTGRTQQGDFRVFSWVDHRAKAFLGFELGDQSPVLGRANLIGTFKPEGSDLKDVKYHSFSGKAYYESAFDELNNNIKDANNKLGKLIDASNFMKMNEIIPTGVQGKAIYGEGNYIIDGAAGTGKSTTVLQKIKLLQAQNNVSSNQIAIIVKSKQVISSFQSLLEGLGVDGVQLYSQVDFIDTFFPSFSEIDSIDLMNAYSEVGSYVNEFEAIIDNKSFTIENEVTESKKIMSLKTSDSLKNKITLYFQSCENYSFEKNNLNQRLAELKEQNSNQIKGFQRKLEAKILSKKLQEMIRNEQDVSGGVHLDLGDQADVREAKFNYESELDSKIKKAVSDNRDKLDRILKSLDTKREILRKEMCSKENMDAAFPSGHPYEILSLYLNEYYPHIVSLFHTVIIDEAQDIPAYFIEIVRLNSSNTILAGDESQTESESGVGLWSNVLLFDEKFSIDGKTNIFKLRHNFRQTYELGAVSYNYRQLMLNRTIEDIKQDYYENQIGFNRPELEIIYQPSDFYNLVDNKIKFIKSSFTSSFPLVIFYESESSLIRFKELLEDKYKICMDLALPNNEADIMLVSTSDIAGREFPVVIAPIVSSTSNSSLYIMLSRAKIDLSIILSRKLEVNTYIKELIDRELIIHKTSQENDLGW